MNAKKLIAAVAVFAAAGSAFAEEWVDFNDFQSTKTRAEVVAELKAAQAQGTNPGSDLEYNYPDIRFVSTKTRAQVLAELKQAQEDGSYALAHQEYEGQVPAATTGARTRLANNSEGQSAHVN